VLQKLNALVARAAQPVQPAPVVRVMAPAAPAPAPAPATAPEPAASQAIAPMVRAGSRNLLSRAAYGKPDDLKKIKGVATVMEKMMHDIGVYYFWQIAEWNSTDIDHADAQLKAFHGRISRDEWVKQAVSFARDADSARKPAGT
jgi:predicted flap endonuclease-1-like 5' DNA nuclease